MKLKFLPQNISVDIEQGKSVMDMARENKLPVSSSCNGMCSCAECRVYVVEGEAHILPPTTKEVELIGGGHFIDNRRLSCQLFCFGDVTVDLSEQVERQKQGGKKQFLKRLSKENGEESASVGGILVDQEMSAINISEEEESLSEDLKDGFYSEKGRYSNSHSLKKESAKKPYLSGGSGGHRNRKRRGARRTGGFKRRGKNRF